jgi:arsenate reductase (thioredoxin)
MKILILCTGNSCRSQMAHGFMESFDKRLTVRSAGTEAAGRLNEKAVEVMKDAGIDISHHTSDPVDKYLDEEWDYVITVCGGANENCPVFTGKVKTVCISGLMTPRMLPGPKSTFTANLSGSGRRSGKGFTNFTRNKLSLNLISRTG